MLDLVPSDSGEPEPNGGSPIECIVADDCADTTLGEIGVENLNTIVLRIAPTPAPTSYPTALELFIICTTTDDSEHTITVNLATTTVVDLQDMVEARFV